MAKKNYAKLNVKAAAITGLVFGFVWSLLAALTVTSMMDSGMMYGYGAGLIAVVLSTIIWAIAFGFIAAVYNYTLKNLGK